MISKSLYNYMELMLRNTPDKFTRYINADINWESRLIGITGPRGVGKSTMLLQRIKANMDKSQIGTPYLYVTADHT